MTNMKKTNLILIILAAIIVLPSKAMAGEASMFFSSGHGVYQYGRDFTTRFMINSGGRPGANAAEAVIKYDPKVIKVKSVDKSKSIFMLWTSEPKIDNAKGTLTFGGGTYAPYKDAAGLVFYVTFTPVSKGKANITYENASILSATDDPQNILKDAREGNMTIGSAADVSSAKAFTQRFSGRILLQVQAKGEAWYVNPTDNYKYYLGRPADAFNIMRKLGLGVKHSYMASNTVFPSRMAGRILLDVEDSGKAYYIYPVDRKAYYLGRPEDAFRVMREKGMGMANVDIYRIWDWAI